ncbi:hypothetical protein [Georgenia sp. SYP-B2076]|uniref:DUF7144 family membrane protein n=1 Tax=Georgenia sp. SYP-B2076 TaxID=2495881 RepID=UPI000F8F7135|nr:hypothetical protein [Georgenia sp. SYP-B2076]
MTDTTSAHGYDAAASGAGMGTRDEDAGGWVGWLMFAGTMMWVVGMFHAIQGLIALFSADYYLVGASGLAVQIDFSTWGWVHLIGGVVIIIAGVGVFAGQTWARVVGVILAVVSALLNFAFIAAYPFWSMIMIAVDVFVIYALCVHGRALKTS